MVITKQLNLKNRTYYFYNDLINIKDFDPKLLKLDKKNINESWQVLRKYSEIWNGIKDCIEKINNSELGKYDKDYMKIKFSSDDDIPLNK